jgi:tetratricopeptide (TPR) repeat protein
MEGHSRYKSHQLALITLSAAAIVLAVVLGASSVLALRKDTASIERSVSLDGGNAEAKYRLARLYQLNMSAGEKSIVELYAESIGESPLYAPSWLGLAELYIESGEEAKARITLARADELIPSSVGHLWESSMLSLSIGDNTRALQKLRKVAEADPARRQRVFDICWDLGTDPRNILDDVVSREALPDYLAYLIGKDRKMETYPAWERAVRDGAAPEELALSYVDYLIRRGDVFKAKSIWDSLHPAGGGDSLVWNGGFEKETESRGFDWRMDKADGVEISYDYRNKTEGERSLKLEFTGENNVDFLHVRQFIPVEPGSHYMLTSDISTDGITTRNGIAWEVYCRGMDAVSEVYTGTVDWTEARLAFDTPPACDYVAIRLRRLKSDKLDNLISGEVWIDNVSLNYLGPVTDA